MTALELELHELDLNLSAAESKNDIMNRCVYNRLSNLINVQAACFDDSLSAVQSAMNLLDWSDIHNLKRFNKLFKNLYHFMGIDRRKMISYLIQMYDN